MGSECCVFILELCLVDCDWKKVRSHAMAHQRPDLKNQSNFVKSWCQFMAIWQRLHLYFSHILPAQSKDSRTIALLSTNFTLSLFYTCLLNAYCICNHCPVDFQTLLQFTSFFALFIALGFLAWSLRRGLGVLFFSVRICFKDTEKGRKKASMSEGSSSNHPDQLKASKMKNPQFRKQAKVNFHANCSVTVQECSAYRVNSAVLYSQEERHAIPAPL